MPIHKLKLLERKELAKNTIELIFEKPAGFTFVPGQYGGFTLINPSETDAGGHTRRFSLLSSPDDNHIAIATRIQNSAYKRILNQLPIGAEIKFAGPTGNFILHSDTTIPAVMIAGGIGVTPFYSMIKHAIHHHTSQNIFLFYGNQSPSDTVLLDELKALAQTNPHFKLIATMANADDSWQGEKGYISYEMLKKYLPEKDVPMYYVCGSPAMVNALRETLAELEINPEKIKVEDFPGY